MGLAVSFPTLLRAGSVCRKKKYFKKKQGGKAIWGHRKPVILKTPKIPTFGLALLPHSNNFRKDDCNSRNTPDSGLGWLYYMTSN